MNHGEFDYYHLMGKRIISEFSVSSPYFLPTLALNFKKVTMADIDRKKRNQTRGVNILIKVIILDFSVGYAVNMYHGT